MSYGPTLVNFCYNARHKLKLFFFFFFLHMVKLSFLNFVFYSIDPFVSLDSCSFIRRLEIRLCQPTNIVPLFKSCLGYSRLFPFPYEFHDQLIHSSVCCDLDFVKSIGQFWEYIFFNNNKESSKEEFRPFTFSVISGMVEFQSIIPTLILHLPFFVSLYLFLF